MSGTWHRGKRRNLEKEEREKRRKINKRQEKRRKWSIEHLETRETDGIPIESFFVGRRRSLTHLPQYLHHFDLTSAWNRPKNLSVQNICFSSHPLRQRSTADHLRDAVNCVVGPAIPIQLKLIGNRSKQSLWDCEWLERVKPGVGIGRRSVLGNWDEVTQRCVTSSLLGQLGGF